MAITQNYVDYGAGNDTTGDGSIGTPWKTLQKALDTLTRNTTDGNQVNLKAGTAHVNAAALDLTTFIAGGALTRLGPLIVRGYTSAANDGGVGEIDCGGYTMWAATTYDYVILVDLALHSFGDNDGVVLDTFSAIEHCAIHKGASSPSGKTLLKIVSGHVSHCHIYNPGASGTCIVPGGVTLLYGNFINTGADGTAGIVPCAGSVTAANVILCGATGAYGIRVLNGLPHHVIGNVVYNTTAGTTNGILLGSGSSDRQGGLVVNNIVVGWSGAGGIGIYGQYNVEVIGHNAYYNNTTDLSIGDQKWVDLTANDVALAANPFTDAANGDFSLTAAGKTALAAKGFPLAYLGAHANTVPNLNIGPIQMAAGGTGGGTVNLLHGKLG